MTMGERRSLEPTENVGGGLHRRALVIDTMAGGPGVLTQKMCDELECLPTGMPTAEVFRELERLQTRAFHDAQFGDWWKAVGHSGVDVLSISVGAWGDKPFSFRGAVYDLGEWHQRITWDRRFVLVREPQDLQRCTDPSSTGVLLGFQDSAQLEGDLRNVETFHGLGVRMIQLTYNERGAAGCGCTEPSDEGLTTFGRDLVRELNEVGIVVDLSHCGARTTMEALELSEAPVAVSHAACAAIHPHARNKSDDVLRALGQRSGYFGVCLVPAFLAMRTDRPSVEHFVRHVMHALEMGGPTTVGIGTDWGVEHSPPSIRRRLQAEATARGFRPDDDFDFAVATRGFETWAMGFPRLTDALLGAGLDEPMVEGILGKNFSEFWQTAVRER
jgi:membrane dipeptidase